MKVSIITAVLNNRGHMEDCIKSVLSQEYTDLEHIIVDGSSTDGTIDIIRKHESKLSKWISEPDKGIYDALNKGIKMATGQVVGILHSDDMYADEGVVKDVMRYLNNHNVESCYGDLVYVDRFDTGRFVRYWKAGEFVKKRFKYGWMPPHPTFFAKKSVYDSYGLLNLDFPLAADYELMLRFLYRHNVSTAYIPKVLVKMRIGGTSNPGLYTLKAIRENYKAWTVNGLRPSPKTFVLKPLSKVLQYFSSGKLAR